MASKRDPKATNKSQSPLKITAAVQSKAKNVGTAYDLDVSTASRLANVYLEENSFEARHNSDAVSRLNMSKGRDSDLE